MNSGKKIVFVIAVIGAIACLISFILALFINDSVISGIIFGVAGLFCLATAAGAFKHK